MNPSLGKRLLILGTLTLVTGTALAEPTDCWGLKGAVHCVPPAAPAKSGDPVTTGLLALGELTDVNHYGCRLPIEVASTQARLTLHLDLDPSEDKPTPVLHSLKRGAEAMKGIVLGEDCTGTEKRDALAALAQAGHYHHVRISEDESRQVRDAELSAKIAETMEAITWRELDERRMRAPRG